MDWGEKTPVTLTTHERDLIINNTLAGDNLTEPLAQASPENNRITVDFSLVELDELLNYVAVAAEAINVEEEESLREELEDLFGHGSKKSQIG
jgi:predicted DNA-binding transcriptional regulator YafY